MFTRYKGINIPENYSGNRFKSPPETETKLHKPVPSYTGTKTSISPTFEEAIKKRQASQLDISSNDEATMQDEYKDELYDDLIDEAQNNESYFEESEEPPTDKADDTYKENTTSSKGATSGNGVISELGSLISKLTSSLKSEDLLILAIIVLLISENNNDDNMLILPLLGLLLYS